MMSIALDQPTPGLILYLCYQVFILTTQFLVFLHQLHDARLACALPATYAFMTPDLPPSADQASPLLSTLSAKMLHLTLCFRSTRD